MVPQYLLVLVADQQGRLARIPMQGDMIADERVTQTVLRRCLGRKLPFTGPGRRFGDQPMLHQFYRGDIRQNPGYFNPLPLQVRIDFENFLTVLPNLFLEVINECITLLLGREKLAAGPAVHPPACLPWLSSTFAIMRFYLHTADLDRRQHFRQSTSL